jgi:hypothetical protein
LQKVEATVEALDVGKRQATLKGPDGSVTLTLGPDVKNLDKVKVGDKVVVSYYQGLAAQISKGATTVKDRAASDFAYRAEPGKPPGGGVGESVTSTVKIEDIDPASNTVAFRRADGTVRIAAAQSPEMQKFVRTLKPGDSVDVTYTESVAVNVVPAPASR